MFGHVRDRRFAPQQNETPPHGSERSDSNLVGLDTIRECGLVIDVSLIFSF